MDKEILNFDAFIKKFFPSFQVDGNNAKVIGKLGLWANRNEKFNNSQTGDHIDRGILLFGSVGVGKDAIIRLLYKYLSYLRSQYVFDSKVVWEYAALFSQKDNGGYEVFNEKTYGNRYYEELGLTDETTNEPTREIATHFGNKVLIGREIINMRYQLFTRTGYQAHFSTNLSDEDLKRIYGARSYDRLLEMCNFIHMPGQSRRGVISPSFMKNRNQSNPPPARETEIEVHEENKRHLEVQYQKFCKERLLSDSVYLDYYTLRSYNCDLGTDEELRFLMESVEKDYQPDPTIRGNPAQIKKDTIWKIVRRLAVGQFYQKMKDADRKTIFGQVDVDINSITDIKVKPE